MKIKVYRSARHEYICSYTNCNVVQLIFCNLNSKFKKNKKNIYTWTPSTIWIKCVETNVKCYHPWHICIDVSPLTVYIATNKDEKHGIN